MPAASTSRRADGAREQNTNAGTTTMRKIQMLCLLVCLLALTPQAFTATINVPADQPTIQAGINAAVNGDEVVVAPGTYNEIIDFAGKAITVRSSGGAAATTIDATGVPDPGDGVPVVRIDNAEGSDTVLDGFTITGGTGDTAAFGVQVGGGVFINGADPTLRDCTIENNTTNSAGGGGVCLYLGGATLEGCTIRDNDASSGEGGAIVLVYPTDLTLTGCHLDHNTAQNYPGIDFNGASSGTITITDSVIENHTPAVGGPAVNLSSFTGDVTIDGCLFRNNHGNNLAGAVYVNSPASVRITASRFEGNSGSIGGAVYATLAAGSFIANCTFVGNTATGQGGAVEIAGPGTPLINCSFSGNAAPSGAAIYVNQFYNPTIENCVAWGNTGGATIEIAPVSGTLTVNHSIVEGGWGGAGTGNLDVDPLFADAAGGDLSLLPGSPAIDSGDSPAAAAIGATDLIGNPRLADDPATADTGVPAFGATIDRGAYEYQGTLGSTGACCLPLGECVVTTEDDCLAAGGTYNGDGTDCGSVNCAPSTCAAEIGDMNCDGAFDLFDIDAFVLKLTNPTQYAIQFPDCNTLCP